jgi:N-acetylmuramoyl-L-alanine amidase
MLRAVGAEVVDIRPDTAIVPLIERPIRAAAENAHMFVSVHFNAFPDGVNPFENHGTTNFYFWPQSLELARHFQREILGAFGLPDRGVRFQNLAIPRTQWMPSVLTETLFMMFPEQEAALRDPRTLDRIAAAHLRAMESFVRERAIGPSSEVGR